MQRSLPRVTQLRRLSRRKTRWPKILLGIGAAGLALVCAGVLVMTFKPGLAAQNIDRLRDIIGDEQVARLETTALIIQDSVQRFEYQVGLVKSVAPWTDSSAASPLSANGSGADAQPTTASPDSTPGNAAPIVAQSAPPNGDAQPAAGSAPWHLAPLTPFGNTEGEGVWTPYITAADGVTTVAYRTFLQPDRLRPYSIAAIVAFDLHATRLHFVLGSAEPRASAPQPSRTGEIPAADRQPGVLLATFNGGFKARNGQYGAMANGLVALPPIDGLATVAIDQNGGVRIGQWGADITDTPDLVAWRQNGKLIVSNGQVSRATVDPNEYWGLTPRLETITWRSALGVSTDGRTLYYEAGPQLDVLPLAQAMAQTNTGQAMQLDVNAFWVHFTAVRSQGPRLLAEPLLKAMSDQVDRYLTGSGRDFFYVTAITP